MKWNEIIFQEFCQGKIEGFYTYFYPDLLVYALSLSPGNDVASAEDWVQEAVEKAYYNRFSFKSPAHWKAFIITCIRNRGISAMRNRGARENYIGSMDASDMVTEDAMTDYIEVETRSRLFNAISSLPEEYRRIFHLSFEEGLKNRQIAEMLGVAEITIKKRKARMIEHLRKIFGNDPYILLLLEFAMLTI